MRQENRAESQTNCMSAAEYDDGSSVLRQLLMPSDRGQPCFETDAQLPTSMLLSTPMTAIKAATFDGFCRESLNPARSHDMWLP